MERTAFLLGFLCLVLKLSANSDHTTVPFFKADRLIYVEAEVEHQRGYFIVDTGYRGILLNHKYFKGIQTDRYLMGVNGEGVAVQGKLIDLRLGSIVERDLYGEVSDLQRLEEQKGLKILGLIGSTFFKKFEIVFDYFNNELTLYRLDRKGRRLTWDWSYRIPSQTVDFKWRGHLPIIDVEVGEHQVRLGIDSGAESNLFDQKILPKLKSYVKAIHQARIIGLGRKAIQVHVGTLHSIAVGTIRYSPMRTMFVNLIPFLKDLSGGKVQGLIGYEFLSQYKTGINFRRQEIYIWNEENVQDRLPSFISRRKEE